MAFITQDSVFVSVCVCLIQKVSELNMIQEEMRKMKEIEVQREQDIVHVRTQKKNHTHKNTYYM